MNYSVIFTAGARKELHKLDRYTAALILGWIEKNLSGCPNPRAFGKPLVANHQGKWRYRVGNYRLLAQIDDYLQSIGVQVDVPLNVPPRRGKK